MSRRSLRADDYDEETNKSKKERILDIIEHEFDLELLLKYREMRILEHEIERGNDLKELLEKLILNEQVYAEKSSSGRLSAPPQINSPFDNFDSVDSEVYSQRSRSGLNRRSHAYSEQSKQPASSLPQYQFDIRPDGTVCRMRCPSCGAEKFRSMLGFLNHCRIHCKLSFSNQEDRLQRCGIPVPPEETPAEYQNLSNSLIQKSMELAQICADVLPTKVLEDSRPEIHVSEENPIDLSDFGLSPCSSSVIPNLINSVDVRHCPVPSETKTSRYYIKKEIIIGNVSRCLLQSGEISESVGGKPPTHFFKIFIRDRNFKKMTQYEEDPGVLKHIKFVRFFLHSAYKPNDVIDVYERPFILERPAWGEFPVRVQLHFYDERNKPVDLIHLLSIFSSTSSRYDQGVERLHEIDIDKNTDFSLSCPSTSQSTVISDNVVESILEEADDSKSISSVSTFLVSELQQHSHPETHDSIDPASLKYCRFCGVPHMPQHSLEIIQKNCINRPRKIRFNSRTLPSEIFSNCKVLDKEFSFSVSNSGSEPLNETLIDDDSCDSVKFVAACVDILDLPFFIPSKQVCSILAFAMKSFLKDLMLKSIKNTPEPSSRAALDQNLPVAISPLHIFHAITQDYDNDVNQNLDSKDKDLKSVNVFDFLSNSYFSASTGSSKASQ